MYPRWAVAVLTVVSSCYSAPTTDEGCTITCTLGVANNCPGDLTCTDGYCVGPGQVCKPTFVQVAAGTGFACGIDGEAALWCWGSNQYHQVDASDALAVPLARRIDRSRHWTAIAAGGGHVCGLADGALLCWGKNDRSQVTDTVGTATVSEPLDITIAGGPSTWKAVAAGVATTCAIGDGMTGASEIWCWGANDRGQRGDGTTMELGVATQVMAAVTDWTSVSLGSDHACAISATTGVHCWGRNDNQQVGGGAQNPQLTPFLQFDAQAMIAAATSVAVADQATCAIAGQQLYCWGGNSYGELGEQNAGSGTLGTPGLATTSTGWTSVTASRHMFCGLRGADVVCWGSTQAGGLGNGQWSVTAADKTFAAIPAAAGATQVSAGWDSDDTALVCAVTSPNLLCWGDNRFGQLANGTTTMALSPTAVADDHHFSQLAVGAQHACGLEASGVLCWGSTVEGQATGVLAGNQPQKVPCNTSLDCDVPTPRLLNFFTSATQLALGALHTCAYHNGLVTCWGDSSAGQLVTNTPKPPRERDITAPAGTTWSSLVPTGRRAQCAIAHSTTADTTYCWGTVIGGHATPTAEPPLDGAKLALGTTPDGGADVDCIVDPTGGLQCMGDNSYGEYGDGGTSNNFGSLTPIARAQKYVTIAGSYGAASLCAIREDTQIECWGTNTRGQTSSTDLVNPTTTPTVVPGLSSCTSIAVGHAHACAICAGAIDCWGDNQVAQLGISTLGTDPVPLPQKVADPPPGDTWTQVLAGSSFTCALSGMGRASCWGFDPHGALGNGGRGANLPSVVRSTPAQ